MTSNSELLNDLITFDDKTDDLLEQKIRENEANIQAYENINNVEENSNNSKKDETQIKEPENPSKDTDEINNQKNISINEDISNKNDNHKKLNKNANHKNYPHVTPIKKENNLIENNNSYSSNKINNNTTTNISNSNNSINQNSNINKNININININHDNKNSTNFNDIKYNKINNKKNNNYCPNSEKRRNTKNRYSDLSQKNNFKNINDNNYLYDNIDQSLYYQYTTLLSNQKIRNKSAEKRPVHRNKKINDYKNNSMNNDYNEDNKFSSIYKRFLEEDKKQKEKLAKLKKNKEEQENKKYLYKPKINKKSLELTSKNKEDFYTRQKKLMEQQKQKEAKLREKYKKKEKDEINKNNILLTHNLSIKEGNKKNRHKSIDETINKLYEWDMKRKEKIITKIINKEKKLENDIYNNQEKYKIKVNRNKVIKRLYNIDIAKRKERQEILNQIYTPSFQPFIGDKKKNSQNNQNKDKSKDKDLKQSIKKLNPNPFSYNLLTSNQIEKISDEEDEDNDKDNLNLDQLIRERLFSKIKSKVRYKSAMKFNVVKDDINYNNEKNYFDDDNLVDNYNNNISNSFVIRKIKRKVKY